MEALQAKEKWFHHEWTLIAPPGRSQAFGMRDALGLVCIAGGVVVVVTQVFYFCLFRYVVGRVTICIGRCLTFS